MRFHDTLVNAVAAAMGYQLHAPTEASRGLVGLHRGARAGSSLEYKDFREYQVGDDLRTIDWAAYARTDKLTVKTYHEEVIPHLDLIVDGSRSMDLADSKKASAAMFLAAFFATAAQNAGFRHQAWLTGDRIAPIENGADQPLNWPEPAFAHSISPQQALAADVPGFRRQGMRLFVSDLLWLGDPKSFLLRLTEHASTVLVVQLLAVADRQPPERGRYRLVDAESGETVEMLMDHRTRTRYQVALERHQAAWSAAARETGAALVTMEAEALLDAPRFDDGRLAAFLQPC